MAEIWGPGEGREGEDPGREEDRSRMELGEQGGGGRDTAEKGRRWMHSVGAVVLSGQRELGLNNLRRHYLFAWL